MTGTIEFEARLKFAPSWDDAPEWAQWLAQDSDLTWWWYEKKPVLKDGFWDSNVRGGDSSPASKPGDAFFYAGYCDTLQQCPETREPELKPCPFCGCETEAIPGGTCGAWYGRCMSPMCGWDLGPFFSKALVIAAINRRADDD